MSDLAKMMTSLLSIVGPAPKGMTGEFRLKAGGRIVAIGDSITQAGGYLKDIDAVLAAQYPSLKIAPIINVGISGQKAEDLVTRFKKDVVDQKPSVVTLSIGINDVWHRLGEPHDEKVLAAYKMNVAKMVDMAQAAGIKVILLSPTLIMEDAAADGNKRLAAYIAGGKQIAAEKKCGYVDLHQLFLDCAQEKPSATPPGNWLTNDGVHMNPPGDALMAIGVLRGLGVPDEKIKA